MTGQQHYDDQELIRLIQQGRQLDDPVKFLYRTYFDGLSSFITANSGSLQDAEDVFQETLVVFIDCVQKGKFRGAASIKTFLYAITKNRWLNELKRRNRSMIRDKIFTQQESMILQDVQSRIALNETKQLIDTVMGQLGETCKKILRYYYYEELSMKEILERLDYENEQVVRNKKYKCMKRLTALIDSNPALKDSLIKILANGDR